MSFIDNTYFINDINLPSSVSGILTGFISKFEEIVLTNLLGYTLYKAMLANPSVSPYKELIEGEEYSITYNGNTRLVKWMGFKNASKISLVSYYVYIEYMRNKVTHTTSTGESVTVKENSRDAGIFGKIMSSQSRFEELYGYVGQSKLIPSAYNYLTEKEDLFPEWEFECMRGNINSHDL